MQRQMTLHLPDNVKVHFAGGEVQNQYIAAQLLGVSYSLYTCYPWVERKLFPHPKSPIMAQVWQREDTARLVAQHIAKTSIHTIQDSGLLTLMFGSQKDVVKDAKLINRWYDGLVEYTLNHGQPVTCVEVDCQRILGVEAAWEFRQRMRRDLPNNRIINVFHLPDGQKGLDRLIEYSDYIAISVPELRFNGKKNNVAALARYIKKKKPSIDIHLLGCTEISLIKECRFCTSADSTSWIAGKRFGYLKGRHIRTLDIGKCRDICGEETFAKLCEYNKPENAAFLVASIEHLKAQYQRAAGNQDYYKLQPSVERPLLSTSGAGII